MPFIRQTRDKRGFEQTLVLHAYHPGGPQRPRVIYMFRSPANLRVGRQALDAEVKEALEHTHPDVSFDWSAVSREVVAPRPAPPNERQMRRPPPRPPDRPAPRPTPMAVVTPAPMPADDATLLGRVLGAAEAARCRQRYCDLLQRIGRRSRTPEERERLFERARRLNPDDWTEEAAIRAARPTIDAQWDAISGELPSRRRGRRGGRRRPEDVRASSAIMTPGEGVYDVPQDSQVAAGGAADAGGDRGAVGPESGAEAAADSDVPVGD